MWAGSRDGRSAMTESGAKVNSPIGEVEIDSGGAVVGVVRMDPQRSYSEVPELLKHVIDDGSDTAWQAIKQRITILMLRSTPRSCRCEEAGLDATVRKSWRGKKHSWPTWSTLYASTGAAPAYTTCTAGCSSRR
jgi:hypothetical protein